MDFADVQTVMTNSGVALMGSGRASGEDRAMAVANMALESPLLNHNDIAGAKNILINITSGEEEITLEETYMIPSTFRSAPETTPTSSGAPARTTRWAPTSR